MRRYSFLFLFAALSTFSLKAQNYAFNFTNRTDIVTIGEPDMAPPWTAEMWVYKKATTVYSSVLNGNSSKLELETWNNAQKVGITKKGVSDWVFPKGYVVPVRTWTHLAWVCNGTKTYLYVNGVVKDSLAQTINLPMSTIGNAAQTQSPNAYLDEIRLWKVARTGAELSANMSASVDPSDSKLVGYWYCDDQATPATDISPMGRSCAIAGTKYVANTNPFTTNLAPQTLAGASCEQFNECFVRNNATNQDILLINVKVNGVSNPKKVTSFTIGTSGTTNLSDISSVKMFYTGGSKAFSNSKAFGTALSTEETMTFTGTQALKTGNNYFWVAYDVASGASAGNKLDAACTKITVQDEAELIPATGDPAGNRVVRSQTPALANVVSIVPKPVSLVENEGSFTFTDATRIVADAQTLAKAGMLSGFLKKATGYPFEVVAGGSKENNISLEILPAYDATIGDEGYYLEVTSTGIVIKANKEGGIFYGTQTLRQLLPVEINTSAVVSGKSWTIPNVKVTDYPRFSWRGLSLDVSRHFFSVDFVKKYIDAMAMNKLNVFHWHLMDDQGFRMEVKSHPELTAIGSVRDLCPDENTPNDRGYYTQEEIKDIVAYALERNVNIEPELETPGHAAAWLAALPGLSCTNVAPGSQHVACMNSSNGAINNNLPNTICMGKEYTYKIMGDVINEMVQLFPFKYVHIGGDEANHTPWTTCTDCQKMMADSTTAAFPLDNNHLHNVQTFYLKKLQRMLTAKGKKVVGWTEMGLLDSGSVLQDWVGGAADAINNGHEAIYSDAYQVYLDSYQGGTSEPLTQSWMGANPLEEVYNYNPPTANMTPEQKKLALGIEACLWNELHKDSAVVEYRVLPRIYAVAEAAWSKEEDKDFNDFKMRLFTRIKELDVLRYAYCPLSLPESTAATADVVGECSGSVKLSAGFGSDYYYWNDEANSNASSITVSKSGTYKVYGAIGSTSIQRTFNVVIPQAPASIGISRSINGENTTYLGTNKNYLYNWYDAEIDGNLLHTGDTLVATTGNPVFAAASLLMPQVGLRFNGNNYVSAPALNKSLNTVTYEAWIKLTGTQNDIAGIIFNRGASAYGLNLRSNGQLMYHWNDSFWDWNSGLTVPQNEWVHVALVIKPTSATIYLNDKSATKTGVHNPESFAEAIKLGYDQGNRYFKGLMDEVRVWSVAKTKQEILADMNTQLTGAEPNLVAYYKMNESTGSSAMDMVSGRNATLNAFTVADWNSADPCPVKNAMCESQRVDARNAINTALAETEKDGVECMAYPNPNDGNVTVAVSGAAISDCSLQWFDLAGRMFDFTPASKNVSSDRLLLGYQNIPKGNYLVKVIKDKVMVHVLKVVVK